MHTPSCAQSLAERGSGASPSSSEMTGWISKVCHAPARSSFCISRSLKIWHQFWHSSLLKHGAAAPELIARMGRAEGPPLPVLLAIHTWHQPARPSSLTGQAWKGLSCAQCQAQCSCTRLHMLILCGWADAVNLCTARLLPSTPGTQPACASGIPRQAALSDRFALS